MANLRVDITEPLLDGMDIKFKAPCNCTAVTGLVVYYPLEDESGTGSQTFTFKDALGNNLAGLGNLFAEGAVVKVLVDRTTSAAYIQNAATNKYLENKIAAAKTTLSTSVSSTSTATAATSSAVKNAYDRASSALALAEAGADLEVAAIGPIITSLDATITETYQADINKLGKLVMVQGSFKFQPTSRSTAYTFTIQGLPTPHGARPLVFQWWDNLSSFVDVLSGNGCYSSLGRSNGDLWLSARVQSSDSLSQDEIYTARYALLYVAAE